MNSSMVELTAENGGAFRAYCTMPEEPNGGSVVVLQEIFGVNANIRAIVDDFAAAGYAAIAPDLFWRQDEGIDLDPALESHRERAQVLLKGLDTDLAVADAMTAATFLLNQPGSNGKLGTVGYCIGGKLSYIMATREEVSAAISYYGVAIQHLLDIADGLKAALLLHVAEEDHLCPPDAQHAIARALAHRDHVTVMSYPGVGHAFARRESSSYDAVSATRADAATMLLLAERVAGR